MKKLILVFSMLVVLLVACGAKTYEIKVVDSNGNAVSDVKLQVCTDSSCQMMTTDASGEVVIEPEIEEYSIHVLKVPEGYEYDGSKEYIVNSSNNKVVISLQ